MYFSADIKDRQVFIEDLVYGEDGIGGLVALWVKVLFSSPLNILCALNCSVTRSIAQGNTDQTTNSLMARFLSKNPNYACMGMVFSCFGPRHPSYTNYLCRSNKNHFLLFSYDAMSDRDSNLAPPRRRQMRYVLEPRSQVKI